MLKPLIRILALVLFVLVLSPIAMAQVPIPVCGGYVRNAWLLH